MTFLNALKIAIANFSSVYKILLYGVIMVTALGTAMYFLVNPVFEAMQNEHIITQIFDALKGTFTAGSGVDEVVISVHDAFDNAIAFFGAHSGEFLFHYIFICIMVFFIIPFVLGLAEVAVGEVLYGYMSSQTKFSFSRSLFAKLGKASVLQLLKLIVLIPLNVLIIIAVYFVLSLLATGSVGLVFSAFLILLAVILVLTLKQTLFGGWMPAMIVQDINPWRAAFVGGRVMFGKFFRMFSVEFVGVLIAVLVNFMVGIITLGIGLIITLPMTTFIFIIISMVSYFEGSGLKFYVTGDIIFVPRKREHQGSVKKLKYII